MSVTKETLIRNTIDYGEAIRVEENLLFPPKGIAGHALSNESIDEFAANLDSYRSDRMIQDAIVYALMNSEPFKYATMGQARVLINNVLSELHNAERE